MTKIAPALPKYNGLDPIAQDMIEIPDKQRVVVAVLDCKSFTTDTDTGDQEVTVRVRSIEVLDGSDRILALEIQRRAKDVRTGALPLDEPTGEDE